MIKQIYIKVADGVYKKINTRNSRKIAVTEGSSTYNCRIIVDEIYDLEDNILYTIEQHIGINSNYHTIDLYDHNLKENFHESLHLKG